MIVLEWIISSLINITINRRTFMIASMIGQKNVPWCKYCFNYIDCGKYLHHRWSTNIHKQGTQRPRIKVGQIQIHIQRQMDFQQSNQPQTLQSILLKIPKITYAQITQTLKFLYANIWVITVRTLFGLIHTQTQIVHYALTMPYYTWPHLLST